MTPFVFAAAFDKGFFPGSIVEDSALDNRAVMIGGTTGILGEWGPERADNRYEGRDHRAHGARERKEWRNRPARNESWCRCRDQALP